MKRWKEDIRGIGGLDYIVFKNVPMRESAWGDVIDVNSEVMEKLAAAAIVSQGIPLRGKEVRFLRKTLALTLEAFAVQLALTASAVRKWEIKTEDRLHPINEAAVRAFFAERLGVEIAGKLSVLVGGDKAPKELVLKAG